MNETKQKEDCERGIVKNPIESILAQTCRRKDNNKQTNKPTTCLFIGTEELLKMTRLVSVAKSFQSRHNE
ncbi:hypothetical protein BLOT_015467 [Blomia tropicalis]|nr:hypothetical protein BLOT_015467 [Blomia tropicalis]